MGHWKIFSSIPLNILEKKSEKKKKKEWILFHFAQFLANFAFFFSSSSLTFWATESFQVKEYFRFELLFSSQVNCGNFLQCSSMRMNPTTFLSPIRIKSLSLQFKRIHSLIPSQIPLVCLWWFYSFRCSQMLCSSFLFLILSFLFLFPTSSAWIDLNWTAYNKNSTLFSFNSSSFFYSTSRYFSMWNLVFYWFFERKTSCFMLTSSQTNKKLVRIWSAFGNHLVQTVLWVFFSGHNWSSYNIALDISLFFEEKSLITGALKLNFTPDSFYWRSVWLLHSPSLFCLSFSSNRFSWYMMFHFSLV